MRPGHTMHNIKSHSIAITWSLTQTNFKGPGKYSLAVCPETWMLECILCHLVQ